MSSKSPLGSSLRSSCCETGGYSWPCFCPEGSEPVPRHSGLCQPGASPPLWLVAWCPDLGLNGEVSRLNPEKEP